VELLARVVLERQWILHSWVLMTNHLHLVVETPISNLSEGMRDLRGDFASWFNRVHWRVGHLFRHRFDSKAVERETHLLELTRYLPLNPVRCGLVRDPAEWEWGSYRATAGLAPRPEWLEVDWTLDRFDAWDLMRAQALFREYVRSVREVEYDPHAAAVGGWLLGSPEFCERVQSWIDEKLRSREHPKRQRRVVLARFDLLVQIIEKETGEDPKALAPWSRGPGRKLMADLGHEECGLTFEALAEVLRTSAWAAGKLRKRSRALAVADAGYAGLREKVRRLLVG